MTTFHSNSYTQEKLHILDVKLGERLEDIVDYFSLNLRKAHKFYVGACPVHGGDNITGFNIFHTGENMIGNWRCFTHKCQNIFNPTLIGFVRGVLSHREGWTQNGDDIISFRETLNFIKKFLGNKEFNDLKIDYAAFEQKRFDSHIQNIYARKTPKKFLNLEPSQVLSGLIIPSDYHIHRGYSEEILTRYDVGLCDNPDKLMYDRSVAPIYNEDHTLIIGCTGRTIYDRCPNCKMYHSELQKCPQTKYEKLKYVKWRNNPGFPREECLYNYWFAKEFIKQTGIVILVEGPGDVWKLEEIGIKGSVALLGSYLSPGQKHILDNSGAMVLVVIMDPDKAGAECLKQITEECGKSYTIYSPNINNEDLGDTDNQTIFKKLNPLLKSIREELGT